MWYFGSPVPQLCLTRRRRSFFRVVEDAGFVTRSSLSSFLVFLRLVLFQSQDARRTDTKRVTNGWRIGLLIPHGRERRRFFFRAVHCHSEVDPIHQNNGQLLNKEGGGVVFGSDKSNRTRCSFCMFRLRWRKAAVTLT